MNTLVQSTKGKLKPLIGFAVIALSVVSLFILDGVLVWLHGRGSISSTAANLTIAAYALGLFMILLYCFSLSCVYALDGVKLTFSRVYIKNPRLSEQIMLREILFFGSVEDAKRYEHTRTQRFIAKRSGLPTRALLYRRDGKIRRILFSPNEEISKALTDTLKNSKK